MPPNVKVVAHGRAGAGNVNIDGDNNGGNHVDRTLVLPAIGPAVAGEIDLDLRVGLGRVFVDREVHRCPKRGADHAAYTDGARSTDGDRGTDRARRADPRKRKRDPTMKRHEPDWTSLIAGITFCAIALAYLVGEVTHRSLELRWVVPCCSSDSASPDSPARLVRAHRMSDSAAFQPLHASGRYSDG